MASVWAALASLALTSAIGAAACESRPSPAGPTHAPAPAPAAADDETAEAREAVAGGEGTGAGREAPVAVDEPVELGEPVAVEALPDDWPESLPLPPEAEVTRLEAPSLGLVYIEAVHPAPDGVVFDWYTGVLADRGFYVLERVGMGASARIRLARGRERWVIVVARVADAPAGGQAAGEGDAEPATHSWINIRQMPDERPIEAVVDGGAERGCVADLPPAPRPAAGSCELLVGPAIEGIPASAGEPDAAARGRDVALVYVDGDAVTAVTARDDAIRRGPVTVAEPVTVVEGDAATAEGGPSPVRPQILTGESPDGSDDLWLVSWIEGESPERLVVPLDRDLGRADRTLRLSDELGRRDDAAFAPIVHRRRYPEYATAWTELLDGQLAFRVAGLKRDADRVRRSGRFPVGGELIAGPVLASDGQARLALVWGASDGVWLRAIGTDGLPDESARRVEPGAPSWLEAAFIDDGYWVVWGRGEPGSRRGFWARTGPEGCLDDARGSLRGEPVQAWAHPELGPLVQVRRGERVVLVRLLDDGRSGASGIEAELLGASRLPIEWSDLDVVEGGLRGLVRLPTGFHVAVWGCE